MSDAKISGVLLAGGQGRRMGGVDKGLVELHGRPMAAHVLERLAPQVDALLINANQNAERYAEFGHPVFPDEIGGFAGPLAGLRRSRARIIRWSLRYRAIRPSCPKIWSRACTIRCKQPARIWQWPRPSIRPTRYSACAGARCCRT